MNDDLDRRVEVACGLRAELRDESDESDVCVAPGDFSAWHVWRPATNLSLALLTVLPVLEKRGLEVCACFANGTSSWEIWDSERTAQFAYTAGDASSSARLLCEAAVKALAV